MKSNLRVAKEENRVRDLVAWPGPELWQKSSPRLTANLI
jgi:hypothetical protein